jgi:hypothetical protein
MLPKTNNAPSLHAEAAKAFIEKLRALRDEIPHFTTEDFGNRRSQNGTSVPEKFMESASAAVQKSTRLEQAGGADATTLRDAYALPSPSTRPCRRSSLSASSWPIPSASSVSTPASAPSTSTP